MVVFHFWIVKSEFRVDTFKASEARLPLVSRKGENTVVFLGMGRKKGTGILENPLILFPLGFWIPRTNQSFGKISCLSFGKNDWIQG